MAALASWLPVGIEILSSLSHDRDAGYDSVHAVTEQLALARSILRLPDTEVTLPIGVGFLGWQLDQQDGQPGTALLSAVLAANVQAVWFAFGNDLHRWIRHVRAHDSLCGTHTVIFVQTSSITDVQLAINEWKVDVIVVQGLTIPMASSTPLTP